MSSNDKGSIFRTNKQVSNFTPLGNSATSGSQVEPNVNSTCFNFDYINDVLKSKCSIKTSVDINNNSNNNEYKYDDETERPIDIAELSLLNKYTHLRDINYSLILENDETNLQSPLHSVKTFEELKLEPRLLNGIYYMGFQRPSRIQERALPQLLAHPPRNMIAQSQNGTGKTATFSLATLSRIDPNLDYVQAIILSPTFELALQIGKVIEKMAIFLPHIKIAYAVRDPKISNRNEYIRGKEINSPIVIGTPGTVEDWCRKLKIIDLKKLRMFVIDEADVMISLPGFSQICNDLVKTTSGKNCQKMLFSATYSDEVMDFAKQIIENPVIFRLKREEQSLSNIRQFYIECNNDMEKYDAVKTIYSSMTIGQAMIFCRYKHTAHALALQMINDKHCVELLSSELTVEQRAAVINRFRDGKFRVLVVTNVCARGIDIDDISLVLNFEFPLVYNAEMCCFTDKPDYDTYLHRIGRAGRFGRIGYTFNLINQLEKHLLKQVENYFEKPIQTTSETVTSNVNSNTTSKVTLTSDSLNNANDPIESINKQQSNIIGSFKLSNTLGPQSNDTQRQYNPVSHTTSPNRPPSTVKVEMSFVNSNLPNETLYQSEVTAGQMNLASDFGSLHMRPNNTHGQNSSDELEISLTAAEDSLLQKRINVKLREPSDSDIHRSDPTSPLYSLKEFSELLLQPDLLKGVYDMGFQKPSRIQEMVLPTLLKNPPQNLIAQSQSGTGKTAAFSLAILSRIDPQIQATQAIVFAPTYELAIQIGSVIEQMAKYLPYVKIAYAVRNSTTNEQIQNARGQLLTEPIVVGTPGTIEDWCYKKRVLQLANLRMCCIDEADVMITVQGFQKICVNLLRNVTQSQCQIMLFSATYSDEVMGFARTIVPNPLVLRLKRERQTLQNIRQYFISCRNDEEKYKAIKQIYDHITVGQTMIFCRTKRTARDLNIFMSNARHSVRELTSDLEIEQRANVINGFREGRFRVLISTNVASRGIDIDDVSLVINYHMPVTMEGTPDYETYLHRIGRCGRFGRTGYTFNLINDTHDFTIMKQIEEYFVHAIPEISIDGIAELGYEISSKD